MNFHLTRCLLLSTFPIFKTTTKLFASDVIVLSNVQKYNGQEQKKKDTRDSTGEQGSESICFFFTTKLWNALRTLKCKKKIYDIVGTKGQWYGLLVNKVHL